MLVLTEDLITRLHKRTLRLHCNYYFCFHNQGIRTFCYHDTLLLTRGVITSLLYYHALLLTSALILQPMRTQQLVLRPAHHTPSTQLLKHHLGPTSGWRFPEDNYKAAPELH